MATVTITDVGGIAHEAVGRDGISLMELARSLGIDGIVAECGGTCSCATCQIELGETWYARLGAPGPDEADMLDMAEHAGPTTRLSCQIIVSPQIDGLEVRIPSQQG